MDITTENIYFYKSLTDIFFSNPYAEVSTAEVSVIINRADAWRKMVETHRLLTDDKAYYLVQMAALSEAVQESKQAGLFPKVILSMDKYTTIMALWGKSQGDVRNTEAGQRRQHKLVTRPQAVRP